MIPLTTRDEADWSVICAYLRLDDEGRRSVIGEVDRQTDRMMRERKEQRDAWLYPKKDNMNNLSSAES